MPLKMLMIALMPMLAAAFSVAAPGSVSANPAYGAAAAVQSPETDGIVLTEMSEPRVMLDDEDDDDDNDDGDDVSDRDDRDDDHDDDGDDDDRRRY